MALDAAEVAYDGRVCCSGGNCSGSSSGSGGAGVSFGIGSGVGSA